MRKKHKLLIFILIAALIFSLSTSVYADDDRSYYIDDFLISAKVTENGDMEVEEKLTYVFDGAFNGVFRTVDQQGSGGIEEIQVIELYHMVTFQENQSGKDGTFQIINDGSMRKIKIFSKAKNERKTFMVKYLVKKAAAKYNDTSELYWKFIGTDTDVKINNYRVVIKLPDGVLKSDIKAFAHGPLSGNVVLHDDNSVGLTVKELRPRNMVEARVLFPAAALNDNAKYINKDALNSILAEEGEWAEEANRKRTTARVFIGISFAAAIVQLLMIVFIYIKYDKEYKSDFEGIYMRELPYSYSPAVMAVLWNFGHVTTKEITATLMDLVRRRVLELKAVEEEKHGSINSRRNEDYAFVRKEHDKHEQLAEHEAYLMEWFIDKIGDGNEISLRKLKKYTKTTKHAEKFKADYDSWVEIIKLEADRYQFFDKNSKKGIWTGILAGLLGLFYGVFTAAAHGNIAGFLILLFTSIILIIYSALVKRRSRSGVEHFSKWKAFKKYLTDFSLLKEAEMPAITVWEHFLVYAISLGVAKEVIKQLKVVFRDEDFKNSGLTYMYYGYYGHSMNHLDSLDHITTSVMKTTESTYTQALSQLSSSSGGGGGFSGGGGGGGGGGGAGAF